MQARKRHPAIAVFASFLMLLLASAVAARPAQAQTFKVLHTFHTGKGPQGPWGRLIRDAAGNLYGITWTGGEGKCYSNTAQCGTVFKMNKSGNLVWVYSFDGPDGYDPSGGLLRDASGNLFGVTASGGVNTKACSDNYRRICGVVYRLDPTGTKETVLHRFTDGSDGEIPEVVPVMDSAGNLYGTTIWGGYENNGVVYKVDQAGKYTLFYTFQGGADGGSDYYSLIWGLNGDLYGVSDGGTYGAGAVFQLDATDNETVLYSFTGGSDGTIPSSLIADSAGNLYGTTLYGGNTQIYVCDGYEGCGVVFKLSPNSDGTWTETTLYKFCPQGGNCIDGHRPLGGLVRDVAGNLYGTTLFGGSGGCGAQGEGCGVVFKVDTAGNETVLHTFTGGSDGAYPWVGMVMDSAGDLYGTAEQGGDANCSFDDDPGCGVVFKIAP